MYSEHIVQLCAVRFLVKDEKVYRAQECNARKVNCGRVYSAYILKPVLLGRNF